MKALRLPVVASFGSVSALAFTTAGCLHSAQLDSDRTRHDDPPPVAASPVDAAAAPLAASALDAAAPPNAPVPWSVVAEGSCAALDVHPIDNTTFLSYGVYQTRRGGNSTALVLAKVGDDGTLGVDPSYLRGLHGEEGESEMFPTIQLQAMAGTWPDHVTLSLGDEMEGERVSESTESDFVWAGDRWKNAPPKANVPYTPPPYPWLEGSTLTIQTPDGTYPAFKASKATVETPKITALPNCAFNNAFETTVGGTELLLAGHCAFDERGMASDPVEGVLLRWQPGQKGTTRMPLPGVTAPKKLVLYKFLSLPKGDVLLLGNDDGKMYAAHYDGTTWTREITANLSPASDTHLDADGTLWMETGNVMARRSADGTWETEPPKAIHDVVWKDNRPDWVAAGTTVYRYDSHGWTTVQMPTPAFSPSKTFMPLQFRHANDDMWILATYDESRPGWSHAETRRAILHAGAKAAPMRCDNGFSPWPAPATESCTTPLALLARVSKSAPKTYDFPQARRALKGHTELAGVSFFETEIGGVRFLAAKVPSTATAETLAELIAKGVRGSRPEVVCSDAEATRDLPIDLQTGKLSATK